MNANPIFESLHTLQSALSVLSIIVAAVAVTLITNKLWNWLPTSERKRDAVVKRCGGGE